MPSSGRALPAALSRSKESSSSCCFLRKASMYGWYGFDLVLVRAMVEPLLLTCDTECSASTCTRDKSVPTALLELTDAGGSSLTGSAADRRVLERLQ